MDGLSFPNATQIPSRLPLRWWQVIRSASIVVAQRNVVRALSWLLEYWMTTRATIATATIPGTIISRQPSKRASGRMRSASGCQASAPSRTAESR